MRLNTYRVTSGFAPSIRRMPAKKNVSWDAIWRTLAVVATMFLSFFGVYELDHYWNGDQSGASSMSSQSYGPSINWGGHH